MRLSSSYFRAVWLAGGLPVTIPSIADPKERRAVLEQLDGVILSGGDDYPGELYGEPTHPGSLPEHPKRVAVEPVVARETLEMGIPTLAVCMGVQTVAIALQGKLIQDIPDWFKAPERAGKHSPVQHRIDGGMKPAYHPIRIERGNLLFEIIGAEQFEVNSYHHQAMAPLETWPNPSKRIKTIAWSSDGIIEAIEIDDHPWYLGVQWHPERLLNRKEHLALFETLVKNAKNRK